MRFQVEARLDSIEQAVVNIDQYETMDETEIIFRPGQNVLGKHAKDALDKLATPLKNQRGYIIEVQGFSSGASQTDIDNSQRIAETVVRFLVINDDIPVYRIYQFGLGNGPPQASAEGKATRTHASKVEINVRKNAGKMILSLRDKDSSQIRHQDQAVSQV